MRSNLDEETQEYIRSSVRRAMKEAELRDAASNVREETERAINEMFVEEQSGRAKRLRARAAASQRMEDAQ